jgi:hypothetical protein
MELRQVPALNLPTPRDAVRLLWRVEGREGGEGPFQMTDLAFHPLYRRVSHRPGPNRVPALERFLYNARRPRFGAYSLPNLRTWFPKRAVKFLERHHPGDFVIRLYKVRAPLLAGNQAAFEADHAEPLATFPLTDLHQKGALL